MVRSAFEFEDQSATRVVTFMLIQMNRQVWLFYTGCLLGFLLAACNPCSDEILSETTSPDGVLTATFFIRNCGATTDFSSIVSIHRKSEGFRNDDGIVFVANGQNQPTLNWTDAKTLSIECRECTRTNIFRQVSALGNVDLVYHLLQ